MLRLICGCDAAVDWQDLESVRTDAATHTAWTPAIC